MKLVGERRAIAAIILAFYFLQYLLNALLGGGPFAPAMFALAGVYGVAVFSLISGYFWARWYSVGVALFGVITGAVGLWQVGFDEAIVFIGGTHLLATLLLWGDAMSKSYDGQQAWRERFHMDDNAVQRLGKAVIRAGVSLPFVLLYALMPKSGALGEIGGLLALVAAAAGMRALVHARTWGVIAVAAAGIAVLALAGLGDVAIAKNPALGGALLLSATFPYLRGLARALHA